MKFILVGAIVLIAQIGVGLAHPTTNLKCGGTVDLTPENPSCESAENDDAIDYFSLEMDDGSKSFEVTVDSEEDDDDDEGPICGATIVEKKAVNKTEMIDLLKKLLPAMSNNTSTMKPNTKKSNDTTTKNNKPKTTDQLLPGENNDTSVEKNDDTATEKTKTDKPKTTDNKSSKTNKPDSKKPSDKKKIIELMKKLDLLIKLQLINDEDKLSKDFTDTLSKAIDKDLKKALEQYYESKKAKDNNKNKKSQKQ